MQSGILPKVNTSICSSIWRVLSGSGLRNSKTLLPCRGKFLSRNSGLSCSLPYSTLWIPDTARYNFSPLHKGKSMAASSSTPVFGDVYVDDLISSCGNSLDFTKPTAVYFNDRRQSSFLKASPMLMLGISIGVAFNVMFANWMVTVLPIILFLGTAAKALMKGVETWKKKTMMKKEAEKQLESESKPGDGSGEDYKPLPGGPASLQDEQVPISHNVYWKELSMLVYVWVAFLIVQIVKTYIETCSTVFWVLNSLQIPIAVSVTLFEAICLCKGTRVIAGKEITNWKLHQIFLYCSCGIVAGMVGGLLGLGGGFILGPLFHELGIPPQVASATSTFAMLFSSSMSVVQYYLPN